VVPITHLVHASHNVAARQPLQLAARLDEEAAVGDAHRHAPPVAQPDEQAREPALAVQRLRAAKRERWT
jgi:hypothetical protein